MEFTVLSGRHTVSLLKEPVEMAPVGKAQGFHDGGDGLVALPQKLFRPFQTKGHAVVEETLPGVFFDDAV